MTTDSNETTLAGITGIRTVGVPVTNRTWPWSSTSRSSARNGAAVIGHLDERLG